MPISCSAPDAPLPALDPIQLEVDHDPVVSWAAEQNGIPLLRRITVRNGADAPLRGAHLELRLCPGLGEAVSYPLPTLDPGASHSLDRPDYRLPPGMLRQVLELERGEWQLRVLRDDDLLTEFRSPVEILPCHHWPGGRQPVGLLTCFVTPNHPVVAQILKRVSQRLLEATGRSAITGYQERKPLAVKAQAMALVQTLQSLGIAYCGTAASFESWGQKVRFPDMILRDQLANCLDAALLTASCLEQMGLRPLLVLLREHAFHGVWLADDRFPEGVIEDAARLRNLIALDQILVWDSSATLEQPPLTFAQIQAAGESYLAQDDRFQFALDVRVLRQEHFLPLPLREALPEAPAAEAEPAAGPDLDELRQILAEAAQAGEVPETRSDVSPAEASSRWQTWKDLLLDLSLNNRLLNFKPSNASALALEVPDLTRFEDLLAADREFQILPRPAQDSQDARDLALLALREDEEHWRQQRIQDLAQTTLHSSLVAGEFWRRAKNLDTLARTHMEEGGVWTLFAGLGFLRWFEDGDPKEHLAPLLLYPVQILFDRQQRRLRIHRLPEDPTPNVTLIERMRRDFSVDVSSLSRLEADQSGVDIQQMLRQVRAAIQGRPRW